MDLKGVGNIFGLDSCHKLGTSKRDNLFVFHKRLGISWPSKWWHTSQGKLFMWLSVCRNSNDCNIQKV